jgi:type I restriction enzyme M protein
MTEYFQEVDQGFLAVMLRELNLNCFAKVGGQPSISQSSVLAQTVPLPPLDVQQRIVDEIEAERKLVEANRKLIEIYEQKVQAKLAEIWGEEKND